MNQPTLDSPGEHVLAKSYATFGLRRSLLQVQNALRSRRHVADSMAAVHELVDSAESRISHHLGRSVRDLDILEIGPGQGMERATYFGRHNRVTALDLDVIPQGFAPRAYWHMWQRNGLGRVAKSVGRHWLIGRANRAAWAAQIGVPRLTLPAFIQGDICAHPPAVAAYDVVMSWSVFEHLADPRAALRHVNTALRPGGLGYISLHLYTANNGHHDIRAFTGREDELPLWAHLRPAVAHHVTPSAYLNRWRLAQWRDLFDELAPGHHEILESFEHRERYGPRLTGALAAELRDYSDDELLTVNAVYIWRKPA